MIENSRITRLRSGAPVIGLLFNPLSGRIRKRKDAIRRVLAGLPHATCSEVTNASEIKASVNAFVQADIDLLVIVGGDGTVQGVLCQLFATQPLARWPVLMVIPGGTTNMTALDLGACGRPEFILQQLREYLLKQIPPVFLQRRVLCIEQAGAQKVYGMFFGVGYIARAVIFSQSKIKQLRITGEIYSGIITFGYLVGLIFGRRRGAWAPVRMSIIERNTGVRRGTYGFLFASTLDRLLFGMRPYWGQEEEPLHITFVRQKPKRPLRSLLALLSGHGDSLKEQDGYHSYNTEALELLIDDDYIVDGESYRASAEDGPLRITAAGPIIFLGTGKVSA